MMLLKPVCGIILFTFFPQKLQAGSVFIITPFKDYFLLS